MANYGEGKTAADGSYHIGGLATGSYTISAESEQQAWIAEPLKDMALTEGKKIAVPDLHAHIGAVLEGTVVDAETGVPIPYANIELYHGNTIDEQSNASWLHADEHGHFFHRMQPEQMTLLSTQAQFGYPRMSQAEALPVDLREGKTVSVVVKLHNGQSVTGMVTDGAGPAGRRGEILTAHTERQRRWMEPK